MEWKYVDPATSSFPVPEAGMYLGSIYPNEYFEENAGITDSIYSGGGYCLSNGTTGRVKFGGKTHDEFVAELESLGCTKVDELPNTDTLDVNEKGYYRDGGKIVQFCLNDSYWTGKTNADGTVVVNTLLGHANFDDYGNCGEYYNRY